MTKEDFETGVLSAEKSLYCLARSILRNDEDCADAMQNAILSAYRGLHRLREEKYFKTWLTRILINECYKLLNSRKNQISYEEYIKDHAEPQIWDREGMGVFEEIAKLEVKYKVPLILHYAEGYSIREIAEILKTTESCIKMRLYRGRKQLREDLKGVNGYEAY